MVSAVVLINAARGQVEVTGEQIAALPGVYEVFSVAGRVDLVALLRVRANDEVAEIVSGQLAKIDGVVATETLIAFHVYSREDLEAGFSLGS